MSLFVYITEVTDDIKSPAIISRISYAMTDIFYNRFRSLRFKLHSEDMWIVYWDETDDQIIIRFLEDNRLSFQHVGSTPYFWYILGVFVHFIAHALRGKVMYEFDEVSRDPDIKQYASFQNFYARDGRLKKFRRENYRALGSIDEMKLFRLGIPFDQIEKLKNPFLNFDYIFSILK